MPCALSTQKVVHGNINVLLFSFQLVQELQAILQAGEGQLNQPRLHMRATYTL